MTRREDQPLRIEEISRDARDWVLGLGLLRLHVVCFALGMTGLVLLNLYRAPDESWAADGIRLWAIVLACHAAALLAGWATWRAVRPHRLPGASSAASQPGSRSVAAPSRPVWSGWPTPANGHPAGPPLVTTGPTAAAQPAAGEVPANGHAPAAVPPGLPVRGRFSPPVSQPPVIRHGWHPPAPAEVTAKLRATASGAIAAGKTGWRRLSRATQAGLTSITTRLVGPEEPIATPPSRAQPVPPTSTYGPEPPPGWITQSTVEQAVPPGWESVVSPPFVATPAPSFQPEATTVPDAPEEFPGWGAPPPPPVEATHDASSGEASAESATAPQASSVDAADNPPLPTETEWTWMEAAATAWLARREADEGSATDDAAPSPPPGQS